MGLPNRFPSVIHLAADADFEKFVYYEVYAGSGSTATINGISVVMAASSHINIKINSIAGSNIYVLGSPANTVTGLSYSGNPVEHLGGSTYQQ